MKTTSLEAFENMKPKIPNDQQCILLVMSYDVELTYHEIAFKIGWRNPNKAGRRISELLRLEKIKSGNIRKCSIAGTNCNTYLLNDKYE